MEVSGFEPDGAGRTIPVMGPLPCLAFTPPDVSCASGRFPAMGRRFMFSVASH